MSNKAVMPYEIIFKQGALKADSLVFSSECACEIFADLSPDGTLKLKCDGEVVFACRKADILSVTNVNIGVIHERKWKKKLELDKSKELALPK